MHPEDDKEQKPREENSRDYADSGSWQNRFFARRDYNGWLLKRVLCGLVLFLFLSIGLTYYLMAAVEGRPVTLGEAAVFVVQSMTTTGYGELLPFASAAMQYFSVLLMLSGVLMIFLLGGALVMMLLERWASHRAPTSTRKSGHVVFTSFNEIVGRTSKLLLRHGVPYVIAASSQSEALGLIDRGFHSIVADPERDDGLCRLGISRARLLVVCGDDATNVNVVLGSGTLSEVPVAAVMSSSRSAAIARDAGASSVITPREDLGRQLVDWIAADPSPTRFLNLLTVEISKPVLKQLRPSIIHVGARSKIAGKTVSDSQIRARTGATIAAIWHPDGTLVKPQPDEPIAETTLIALGPEDSIEKMATYLGGPDPGGRVIIVGVGRVGQEVGIRLNRAGIQPVAVGISKHPLLFKGELVVGDATKRETLKRAGIEKADTLIVTMNSDSLNIFTVLKAYRLNPGLNIVARAEYAGAVERLYRAGASHVLSDSILGSQLMQMILVQRGLLPRPSDYVIREVPCPHRCPGKTVKEVAQHYYRGVLIVGVARNGKVLGPAADLLLEKNDRLVVLGSHKDILRL